MGRVISKISDIENIRWHTPPVGRAVPDCTVMFLSETSALIRLPDGQYAAVAGEHHGPDNGRYAVLHYGVSTASKSVLDGFVRMKIITREQANEHIHQARLDSARSQRKWNVDVLTDVCKRLNIPIPDVPEVAPLADKASAAIARDAADSDDDMQPPRKKSSKTTLKKPKPNPTE